MENELNLNVFKRVVQKATMDLALTYSQLKLTGGPEGRIQSQMINGNRDIIAILDMPNNMISLSEHDEVKMNLGDLTEPMSDFDIIEKYCGTHMIPIKIHDETNNPRMILTPKYTLEGKVRRQNHSIHMVDEEILRPLILTNNNMPGIDFFVKFVLTDEYFAIFNQIAEHGMRFGKIYFKMSENVLSIDTTDHNNSYANNHDIIIADEDINKTDFVVCFDYKNLCHLMTVVKEEYGQENGKAFTFELAHDDSSGILRAAAEDDSEQYYLFNREL